MIRLCSVIYPLLYEENIYILYIFERGSIGVYIPSLWLPEALPSDSPRLRAISIPRVCVHSGYHLAENVPYCAYVYCVTEGNARGLYPYG